jgi:DNA (cytosine-5)-methyltransferase 1
MKVLSLFSGVGGFDLGLERAGMETVFQCEWDKHAVKILEKHWPHVPRWDDVSTLTGEHILRHAPVIDVVAWGSPCQDLSVAGKRAGLEGARSGLFHQGVRIIKELRELTNGKYPRISIWENVAGALSSGKGADFGQVLTEMDEAGACFSEWRILDAQYFGVPQRRRRVFIVSVFDPATAARCPDPLLPVSESVRRDTQESTASREEPASQTRGSLASGREVANTISASLYHHGTVVNQDANNGHVVVDSFTPSQFAQYTEGVGTVRANGGDLGGGSETLVTFTKGKRAQTSTDNETWDEGRPAPTLNQFDQGDTRATTIIAFASNQRAEVRDLEDRAVAPSLVARGPHAVATTMAVRRLTPLECERLMGWPDDWTAGQSDTHRYKQCGNGVASPVATWIGQQLMATATDASTTDAD